MGTRIGLVASIALVGGLAMAPVIGEAADMGHGAKYTLSMTKDYTASPWTNEMGYANRAKGKLVFGLKNLLLGWTAIGSEAVEYKNNGKNVFQGIAVGFGEALVYTVGGALHVATFPIPLDVPLPENGVHIGS